MPTIQELDTLFVKKPLPVEAPSFDPDVFIWQGQKLSENFNYLGLTDGQRITFDHLMDNIVHDTSRTQEATEILIGKACKHALPYIAESNFASGRGERPRIEYQVDGATINAVSHGDHGDYETTIRFDSNEPEATCSCDLCQGKNKYEGKPDICSHLMSAYILGEQEVLHNLRQQVVEATSQLL